MLQLTTPRKWFESLQVVGVALASVSSGAVCAEVSGDGTGLCRGCRMLHVAFGIEVVHHRGVGYRSKHTDSLCSDPSSAPQMMPMSLCQSPFGPETL